MLYAKEHVLKYMKDLPKMCVPFISEKISRWASKDEDVR